MTNVSEKSYEKIHILWAITSPPEKSTVHEIMWKRTAQPGRPQMAI
jgi:hypothetical protein